MKARHITIMITAAIAFLLVGCGNKTFQSGEQKDTRLTSNVLYYCPMHPEIIREEPGDCPICGMKLVEIQSPGSAADSVHDLTGADSLMHKE